MSPKLPVKKCHGEEPAGKALEIEGKKVANIHKTHFDTFECLQCHKGHSQSVIACAECHKGAQSIQVPNYLTSHQGE